MVSDTGANVTNIVCSIGACFVLLLRLGGSLHIRYKLDFSALLVITSIVVAIARSVMAYTVALNPAWWQPASSLSHAQLVSVRNTAVRIITTRILITTFYWLQVSLLLVFYARLLETTHEGPWKKAINATWILVVVTYVAVVMATALECRPFSEYWQTGLHRPMCQKAYAQLYTQGISNIVLDGVLLVISLPLLRIKQGSKLQKMRVAALYGLGFVCIVVTSVRIVNTRNAQSSQPVRSMWASLQALVAAVVANSPSVYGNMVLIVRKWKQKGDIVRRQSMATSAGGAESTGDLCEVRTTRTRTSQFGDILGYGGSVMNESRAKEELETNRAWSQHVP